MKRTDLVLTLTQRLVLLLCIFLVCYLVTAALSLVLGIVMSGREVAAVRISALLQDVIAFIVPAVATAVIVSRRPAELLCLNARPRALTLLLVAVVLVVSIPVQEAVISWNQGITFPAALKGLEEFYRSMEEAVNATMGMLLGDSSVGGLVLNILIVGIAAGVSEELLFRGCFQRLLVTGGVNAHVAIWVVAFCFSALHGQIFGFVPRMLLGAYFGYLLLWSGSIWVPVCAHALNNTMYVVTMWVQYRVIGESAIDAEPTLWGLWPTLGSLVLTAAAIYLIRSRRAESSEN